MPQLQVGPPPRALHFVLPLFWQVAPARPYAPNGRPLPVPPSELLAYCRLAGFKLTPFDVEAFTILDHAWIKAVSEPVSI